MTPSLAVIVCFERTIEAKTVALVRSIRRYLLTGGDIGIFAVCPREGFAPSQAGIQAIKQAGVHYVEQPLNKRFAYYPLANKPIVCDFIAREHPAQAYLFLDSDTLFLNPTDIVGDVLTRPLTVRPVDTRNVGVFDFSGSNGAYWRALYGLAGAKPNRRVITSDGNGGLLEYYNSGFVLTTQKELFSQWWYTFDRAMGAGIRPDQGIFFVEQSALSATIAARVTDIGQLDNDLNYPIHLHDKLSSNHQVASLATIRHIHYHKLFDEVGQREEIATRLGFGEKATELIELLIY